MKPVSILRSSTFAALGIAAVLAAGCASDNGSSRSGSSSMGSSGTSRSTGASSGAAGTMGSSGSNNRGTTPNLPSTEGSGANTPGSNNSAVPTGPAR